jgi:hypothetical protein
VVETFQRILFTGVLAVVAQGTSVQILIAMLFACAFIKLYHLYDPWISGAVAATKHMIQWQIYFLFLYALIIRNDILSNDHILLLFCSVLLVFFNIFVEVWYIFYPLILRFCLPLRSAVGSGSAPSEEATLRLRQDLLLAKQAQEQAAQNVQKIQSELNDLFSNSSVNTILADSTDTEHDDNIARNSTNVRSVSSASYAGNFWASRQGKCTEQKAEAEGVALTEVVKSPMI